MGSYTYLINKRSRIRVEAYKLHGGGEESLSIEEPVDLVNFLEDCRKTGSPIECVHESYFELESEKGVFYKDFVSTPKIYSVIYESRQQFIANGKMPSRVAISTEDLKTIKRYNEALKQPFDSGSGRIYGMQLVERTPEPFPGECIILE